MAAEVIVTYEPPADGFQVFPLEEAHVIPEWLDERDLEMADASVHFGEEAFVVVAYWKARRDPPRLRLVKG